MREMFEFLLVARLVEGKRISLFDLIILFYINLNQINK